MTCLKLNNIQIIDLKKNSDNINHGYFLYHSRLQSACFHYVNKKLLLIFLLSLTLDHLALTKPKDPAFGKY